MFELQKQMATRTFRLGACRPRLISSKSTFQASIGSWSGVFVILLRQNVWTFESWQHHLKWLKWLKFDKLIWLSAHPEFCMSVTATFLTLILQQQINCYSNIFDINFNQNLFNLFIRSASVTYVLGTNSLGQWEWFKFWEQTYIQTHLLIDKNGWPVPFWDVGAVVGTL